MTDERLAQIEERASRATEGPWEAHFGTVRPVGLTRTGNHRPNLLTLHTQWDEGGTRRLYHTRLNAAFIAHARTDVVDLLAEVKRLRTLLGEGVEP